MQDAVQSEMAAGRGGRLPFAVGSYGARYAANQDPRVHGNLGPKLEAEHEPDRHELFLLQEDEKKITFEPETRKANLSIPLDAASDVLML